MKYILTVLLLVMSFVTFANGCRGTCWFINTEGYALTANHVVEHMKSGAVIIPPHRYPIHVIALDPSNDLALIKVDINYPYVVPLSENPIDPSQDLGAFGFPRGKLTSQPTVSTVYNQGVTEFVHYKGEHPIYDACVGSGLTIAGMSGGPYLDKDGGAVGLVSGGADADGLSYFIRGGVITQFLKNNHVKYYLNTYPKHTPLNAIRLVDINE